jgi:cell division protein FtsW (lipid II flippase)
MFMARLVTKVQKQNRVKIALAAVRRYRWLELSLFLLPFAILLLEMSQLLIIANTKITDSQLNIHNLPIGDGLIPIIGLIAVFLSAHVLLNIFFRKADQVLLPLVGLLSGLGVLMMTRLGPSLNIPTMGSRQLLWAILGLAICLVTAAVVRQTSWLARYKYSWALFCTLMVLPSVIKGILTFHSVNSTPTRDLLELGGIRFQPSELLKVAVVIFFAAYLTENRDVLTQGYFRLGRLRLPPLRQLGPLVLMLALALMLFLIVRELGLALLIYTLFLCMTYLTNGKISYVLVNLGIFAALAFIGYKLLGYVQGRFAVVGIDVVNWNASSDYAYHNLLGAGQIIQGLIALASGGLFGAGFGLGHSGYVSVIDSDMVLTAYGEEFGLMGLFAILGLYLLLVYRGFRIAIDAPDMFDKLLAAGLSCIFALQTLIIAAGNLKLTPLTGIPLPFLSNGGSALLGNFIIVGLLLRISHNTAVQREGKY